VTHCKTGTFQQLLDSSGPGFEPGTSHICRRPNYSISLLDDIRDNIKIDLNEMACENNTSMEVAEDCSVVGWGINSVEA
jgi:hypothetical protein